MTTLNTATNPASEAPEGFTVHDRATLEWYIRTVTARQTEIATIRAQADAMVADRTRDIEQLEFLYGAQAQAVTRQLLEDARGNCKHVKTFFGNAGFRFNSPRLEIVNARLSLEWAQTHAPDVVRSSVDQRELSKRFEPAPDGVNLVDKTDGTSLTVPGVRITPALERFYVRFLEMPGARDA